MPQSDNNFCVNSQNNLNKFIIKAFNETILNNFVRCIYLKVEKHFVH